MDKEQIKKLKDLGIDTTQCSVDIFDNLLELAVWLAEEVEQSELERFQKEINRVLKPTN